jgi:hypothetical protein
LPAKQDAVIKPPMKTILQLLVCLLCGLPGSGLRGSGQLMAANWLPDPKLTPGEVDPAVTLDMLRSPAFIKARRNVPESEKKEVYRRYGMDPHKPPCPCEVDHLVSLELGGSNSISNLFPQPYTGQWNARMKDRLENYLHRQVLKGKMSLSEAQNAIAVNWTNAYVKAGFKPGIKQRVFNVTHRREK